MSDIWTERQSQLDSFAFTDLEYVDMFGAVFKASLQTSIQSEYTLCKGIQNLK